MAGLVVADHLSKWYGQVIGLNDVSVTVPPGITGLLGPNGAGKTTTIKMLITLLIPTSGSASVLGLDVVKDSREVRKRIGYVFGGERGLYERLSAFDNLRYFAELYAVPPREQRTRIDALLELVGLKGREKERVEGYSRGMRQRLHIARGLLRHSSASYRRSPGYLAVPAELSSGAMTHRLDRLEEAGLIRRLPDPSDRRGIQVELTEAGIKAYDESTAAQAAKEALVTSALTVKEKDELNALLRRLMLVAERLDAQQGPEKGE